MEAQGVDVTNTSLGYTTFDPPETGHSYEELNGHTAFGSRGVNHAVQLGVTCVLAAMDLARSLPWFAASVRDIRMLRIEEFNDLMPAVRDAAS